LSLEKELIIGLHNLIPNLLNTYRLKNGDMRLRSFTSLADVPYSSFVFRAIPQITIVINSCHLPFQKDIRTEFNVNKRVFNQVDENDTTKNSKPI